MNETARRAHANVLAMGAMVSCLAAAAVRCSACPALADDGPDNPREVVSVQGNIAAGKDGAERGDGGGVGVRLGAHHSALWGLFAVLEDVGGSGPRVGLECEADVAGADAVAVVDLGDRVLRGLGAGHVDLLEERGGETAEVLPALCCALEHDDRCRHGAMKAVHAGALSGPGLELAQSL